MRAIGQISNSIAARFMLAGAALLTGASFTGARPASAAAPAGEDDASRPFSGEQRGYSEEQDTGRGGEEVAMAVARPSVDGTGEDSGVALPRPLTSEMATLVRSIFRLQRQGAFAEALTSTTRLTDTTLLADVLAERYLNPSYHPTGAELRRWLHAHADMADAPAIFSRLSILTDKASLPPAPALAMLGGARAGIGGNSARSFVRNALLDRTVQERAALGVKGAQSALHLIAVTPGMTPSYAAQLGGEIAQLLLSQGEAQEALHIGRDAFARGHRDVALPAYVAGLAAWTLDRKAEAVALFEDVSRAAQATPELISAASFWAARGHRELGEGGAIRPWLQRALAAPGSFYGLLARRLLDRHPRHVARQPEVEEAVLEVATEAAPSEPVLTEIDVEAVGATDVGPRVFALLQVGEQERAERALRRYWPRITGDVALARSFQLVAQAAGLNDLALEMADSIHSMEQASGRHGENLPLPALHPRHGFTMDPALVYALTRLESNFDAGAVSGAGAHGLMQLRPLTADFVTGQAQRFVAMPQALHDPALNLEIGQRYVRYLAHATTVATAAPAGGDLIRLLASYNAGPNAIAHWEASTGVAEDPLLYIERLPNTETRAYVTQAFSYLWTYADRLDLPTPSLEALAEGDWPAFGPELELASSRRTPRVIH
ncbi:transglycosylase SLT domain-containing protein [Acetobacter estunensis]|uniref:transglycosylase SLT domain-containing protein n=1 Tax=Acetobacter estunensis TaxID=104097 RepID=UPI001C2DC125|nr:transglycosylase SLT domain-containing protein [Acetobacter estunensis]MBV1837555.1 transglycosylase SLT domain-containing protein [Acetobacter estunensis]